ncbi:hypothetical protein [Streptomyces rectiverticillatus]|uniref:hypothetical protein n=1 Tax=Streptomyces rectiverticillatus TaxID=173860 RepID=UPI001C4BD7F8|nr:hypothetical protein [Streptomyces rectiverticillatus]
MRNAIRRLAARLRIGRKPAAQEPAASAPAASAALDAPPAPPAPGTPVAPAVPPAAQGRPAACGIYVWATAHGIDLRPRHSLLTCTCSTRAERATPAVGAREGRGGEPRESVGEWCGL